MTTVGMEQFDAALAEIAQKIAGFAEKHGSEAFEITGFALQMKAAGKIMCAFPELIAGAGLLYIARRMWPRVKGVMGGLSFEEDAVTVGGRAAMWVAAIVGGIFVFGGVIDLANGAFNPLIWAAALDPYVAIVAKVLGAL